MNKFLFGNHKLKFILCLSLSVIQSAIMVLATYFVGEILTYAIMGKIWEFFKYLLVSLGIGIIILMLNYTSSRLKISLQNKIIYDLRKEVLNNAINYVSVGIEINAGEFDSILRNNIRTIVQKRLSTIFIIVSSTCSLLASLSLVFYYSWIAGLIVIPMVFLTVIIPILLSKKTNVIYGKIMNLTNDYSSKVEHETLFIKSYAFLNSIAVVRRKILGIDKEYEVSIAKNINQVLPFAILIILSAIVFQILMLGINGVLYINNEISIAALTTIGFLMGNASAGVQNITNSIPEYKLSIAQFKEKIKLSILVPREMGRIENLELQNFNVQINNQKFYDTDKNLVLENGKKYLVSGNNGSGKSLLFSSIFTFKDVSGDILVNGKKVGNDWYIGKAWLLPTLPKIFDGNITENVSLFDDKPNLEKIAGILESLDLASISLETDAHTLSDGQKQRVALARALYFDPQWIFLDEALSSIDAKSAETIILGISKQVPSLIVVSHHNVMKEGWFDHEIKIA